MSPPDNQIPGNSYEKLSELTFTVLMIVFKTGAWANF